jgi:ankyrin repeat protein
MSSDNSRSRSSSSKSRSSRITSSAKNFALAKLMNATPVLKIDLKETHPPLIQFIITQQVLSPNKFKKKFEKLIENGEDVNQTDSNGYTVLDYAFVFGNMKIFDILTKNNARFSGKLNGGTRSRKNKSRKNKSRKSK